MMTEYIQMKNILVTKIQNVEGTIVLEVCYENMHEPPYSRLYKAIVEKETQWEIRTIAVYDWQKERFLSVGTLYGPVLIEEIKNKILQAISQDTVIEKKIAL